MAMAAMNMVSAGVFGGMLSFKMSAGAWESPLLCKKNPHFWVPTIKVRPPDGISVQYLYMFYIYFWFVNLPFF